MCIRDRSIIIPANTLATGGFDVDNSCRFNDASPDILKNGTESDGNRKVWTISMWIKRSKLGVRQSLWSWGSNSSSTGELYIDANDFLVLNNDGHQGSSNEVAGVLRDTSAWYHIVWRCDVTESNNIDRWRCYINGVQRLLTDAASVSNADGEINKNGTHQNWIGGAARSLQSGNAVYPFGGYIAEAVFIDGQALAPTSFGEFDEDSGIWKPIDVSGLTFGDEGVYLNFQNASELGTDVSGNGNTYAETGLTAVNQSIDTCTNNYCVMNPLDNFFSNATFSEGNLQYSSSRYASPTSTFGLTKGKWYFEIKCVSAAGTGGFVGITSATATATNFEFGNTGGGRAGYVYANNGGVYGNGGTLAGAGVFAEFGDDDNDLLMMAADLDNNKIYFGKNGTWGNSQNPVNGNNALTIVAISTQDSGVWRFGAMGETNNATIWQWNFGSPVHSIDSTQADDDGHGNFEYDVPAGYFALNSKNLAEYG